MGELIEFRGEFTDFVRLLGGEVLRFRWIGGEVEEFDDIRRVAGGEALLFFGFFG